MRTRPVLIILILILGTHLNATTNVAASTNKSSSSNVKKQMADASCSTVYAGENLGPVRNQEDNNNCYAQVAADILTQHARAQHMSGTKDQFQASALQLQYLYNKENCLLPNSQYGGTYDALEAIRKDGGRICSNGYAELGRSESSGLKSRDFAVFNRMATGKMTVNSLDPLPCSSCQP